MSVAVESSTVGAGNVIRNRSKDPYRENRWHIQDAEGQPLCGHGLTAGRRIQTRDRSKLSQYRDSICAACTRKEAGPQSSVRFTKREALALHRRAEDAARAAAEAARPQPMVVYTPRDQVASLLGKPDGGPDPTKPVHRVNEGVCGMAWVTVRPANSSFARRLMQLHKEGQIRSIHHGYYGGLKVYRPGFTGQSYERGMSAARAYAKVLQEAGIDAYPGGRLD